MFSATELSRFFKQLLWELVMSGSEPWGGRPLPTDLETP